jgi:hypothetical protein
MGFRLYRLLPLVIRLRDQQAVSAVPTASKALSTLGLAAFTGNEDKLIAYRYVESGLALDSSRTYFLKVRWYENGVPTAYTLDEFFHSRAEPLEIRIAPVEDPVDPPAFPAEFPIHYRIEVYNDEARTDLVWSADSSTTALHWYVIKMGIVERFLEAVDATFAQDKSLIEGLYDLIDPVRVTDPFVSYLSQSIGTMIAGSDPVTLKTRRWLVRNLVAYYKIKGTHHSWQQHWRRTIGNQSYLVRELYKTVANEVNDYSQSVIGHPLRAARVDLYGPAADPSVFAGSPEAARIPDIDAQLILDSIDPVRPIHVLARTHGQVFNFVETAAAATEAFKGSLDIPVTEAASAAVDAEDMTLTPPPGPCATCCEADCQASCEHRCEGSCEIGCQHECEGACQATCMLVCQSACQSECQASCETECQFFDSCIKQCEAGSCQAASCQSGCQSCSEKGVRVVKNIPSGVLAGNVLKVEMHVGYKDAFDLSSATKIPFATGSEPQLTYERCGDGNLADTPAANRAFPAVGLAGKEKPFLAQALYNPDDELPFVINASTNGTQQTFASPAVLLGSQSFLCSVRIESIKERCCANMTAARSAGRRDIPVDDASCFVVGREVVIGVGLVTAETQVIESIVGNTLFIHCGLQRDHAAGEMVCQDEQRMVAHGKFPTKVGLDMKAVLQGDVDPIAPGFVLYSGTNTEINAVKFREAPVKGSLVRAWYLPESSVKYRPMGVLQAIEDGGEYTAKTTASDGWLVFDPEGNLAHGKPQTPWSGLEELGVDQPGPATGVGFHWFSVDQRGHVIKAHLQPEHTGDICVVCEVACSAGTLFVKYRKLTFRNGVLRETTSCGTPSGCP